LVSSKFNVPEVLHAINACLKEGKIIYISGKKNIKLFINLLKFLLTKHLKSFKVILKG